MLKTFLLRPKARKIILKDFLLAQSWTHPIYKAWRQKKLKTQGHTNWQPIIDNSEKLPKTLDGQKILIATSTGAHLTAATMEQTLGVALSLRHAQVSFLLCDAALPACLMCEYTFMRDTERFIESGPQAIICESCYQPAKQALDPLNLPIHRYGKYLTSEDYSELKKLSQQVETSQIARYVFVDIQVGEQAFAGACRFFGTGDPLVIKDGEKILRRYLFAALLSVRALARLFQEQTPDVVVLHHGIYVPQGIVVQIARKYSVRVVTWHPAYRKGCFIFSHADTYHRTMIEEPANEWQRFPWSEKHEQSILKYLKSRHTGKQDWIWFHEKPQFEQSEIVSKLGLNLNKPIIGLLTNVIWDAQLHYPSNAFPNMLQWIFTTIDFFISRPDLQLVIRVHPAEMYGSVLSRQAVEQEIYRRYKVLTPNIKIVAPTSSISTYALMELCDSVLIYSTKTGIELSALGQPVIVAGEAWIRSKGFAIDANSPEHYLQILGTLPLRKKLSTTQIDLARRFAYHFFFRRMIPVSVFIEQKGWSQIKLNIQKLEELERGRCPGLDVICDGIMFARPFAFKAEHAGLIQQEAIASC